MTLAEFYALVRESLQSIEGKAGAVRSAWYGANDPPMLLDVFDDFVIVQKADGGMAKIAYAQADDGVVSFGDETAVELDFKPVREEAEITRALDLTGAKWDARILRFGESKNGWVWTRESGEALLPHLKGAPVCLYPGGVHASEASILAHDGPATDKIVGRIQEPRLEADGVYGEIHISEARQDLRNELLATAKAGTAVAAGLSVDTVCAFVPVRIKEAVKRLIKGVKRLFSVDIVNRPSADGGLLRATAGPMALTQEDHVMRDKMLALIRKHRPALLEGRVVESITDEQLEALVSEAMTPPKADPPKPEPKPAVDPGDLDAKLKRIDDYERAASVRETQIRVSEALAAATTLPEIIKARVKKDFADKVATAKEIEDRVKEEIEQLAALSKSGDVKGFGHATLGVDSKDKLQAAMDKLFGVTPEGFTRAMESAPFMNPSTAARVMEAHKPNYDAALVVPAFRGLRDAYTQITGDIDVSGFLQRGRVTEAQFSADWPAILGNTLYRRMLMDYAEVQFNERTISRYGSAVDFRTKEVTILDYFPDIATVDPEVADYAEIAKLNDQKVSYAVIQKGNILTITRKTIINDDLNTVSKLVGRMGRSFRRTLARFIWNFWISNAVYDADSVAWFDAAHANTATTALTADTTGADAVLAAILKLAEMTEQGSGEKLGFPPMDSLYLDVPHQLHAIATRLNMAPEFGAGTANMIFHRFGENNERININPLFTDATDWGLHVAPGAGGRESIQIDFLQGREEPEFFLADMPTVGQMFYGDKIQYKGRHEYGGDVMDFRGATKNIVAG